MSNIRSPMNLSSSGLIPQSHPEEQSSLLGLPYEAYRAGARSQTSYQNSPEPSPQLTPSQEWRESSPSPSLRPKSAHSLVPDTSSAYFLRNDRTSSIGLPSSTRRKRRYLILGSAFPAIAATTELLMLVYFLDVFLNTVTRISPVYSIWPYIACVGSIRQTAFRIFSFIYVFFFIGTFMWDLWLNYDAPRGYLLRWVRLAASVVAGGLLIALVFGSINDTTAVHLYLTSVRQLAAFLVKGLTYLIDHLQRKHYPVIRRDRNMLISKRWKYFVFVGAIPTAILATIGIYACRDWTQNQTHGTTCYILVAMSAISDWVYEFFNVAFNLSLAYDLYQSEHWAKLRVRPQYMEDSMDKGKGREYQEVPEMRFMEV